MRLFPWFHYQPDPPAGGSGGSGGSSGSGGGSGGTGSTSQGGGEERETRSQGQRDIVDRLLARYGTHDEALRVLAGDNWDNREAMRALRTENADLRSKVPPAGALVLTGDDVATWNAIKPLNLKGDKIAERVKRADELEETVVGGERKTLVANAGKVVGYNPDVLLAELDRNKLVLELRDGVSKENGKEVPIKIPYVRKADDPKAAWEKLTEFAERDLKAYLPSLKNVSQGGTNGAGGTTGSGSTFTPLPAMGDGTAHGGGTGGASDLVTRHLETAKNRANRGNPFRKPQGGDGKTSADSRAT